MIIIRRSHILILAGSRVGHALGVTGPRPQSHTRVVPCVAALDTEERAHTVAREKSRNTFFLVTDITFGGVQSAAF